MKKILRKLFGPSERVSKLAREIEEQQQAVERFLQQHNPTIVPYCNLRYSACFSCGLMYWEKDAEHRCTTANEAHCNTFFDLSYKDAHSIIGKTDVELITEYRRHQPHTFGELCFSSDNYVQRNYQEHGSAKPTRFFEFGFKNESPLLLDVTKTAITDSDGRFVGTRGHALDWSTRPDEAIELLQVLLKKGVAEKLYSGGSQNVACYLIRDRRRNQPSRKLQFPE